MSYLTGTRRAKRRKMVLTVVVIRHDGQEKHLAHTLDLTDSSARLGGLGVLLQPGEVVEIKRNSQKAKFQVIWMGAPASAMEGQAGLHGLEPDRSIWGVDLSQEEPDDVDNRKERRETPPVRTVANAGEKRWCPRFECEGAATVRAVSGSQVAHGTVKDISAGGFYVESLVPLPVNTNVEIKMSIGDVWINARGVVRTSTLSMGMGVSFQKLDPENAEKLSMVLKNLKHGIFQPKEKEKEPEPVIQVSQSRSHAVAQRKAEAPHDSVPVAEIAKACHRLAERFEDWKLSCSEAEYQEMRKAMDQLQQKFVPDIDLTPFVPHGEQM